MQNKILIHSDAILDFEQVCPGYYVVTAEQIEKKIELFDNVYIIGEVLDKDLELLKKVYQEYGTLNIGELYIDEFSILENHVLYLEKEYKTEYVFVDNSTSLKLRVAKTKCKVKPLNESL